MSAPYRLLGAEVSPFSTKVRQALRFKNIEHEWVARSAGSEPMFQTFAKAPLLPILVGSSDEDVHQDSTEILGVLERRHPEPSLTPDDPAAAFVCELLEDYADEWLNKALLWHRWGADADAMEAARRTIRASAVGATETVDEAAAEAALIERMRDRIRFVGATADNAPIIEASFAAAIGLLEEHLTGRRYLMGARPSLADFAMAGQLAQMLEDPTAGGALRARAPRIVTWLARMEAASVEGPFAPMEELLPTLRPFLSQEVCGRHLTWMAANAEAAERGVRTFTVSFDSGAMTQAPQRTAARALAELRRKRALLIDDAALAALLSETGCDAALKMVKEESEALDEAEDRAQDVGDDGAETESAAQAAVGLGDDGESSPGADADEDLSDPVPEPDSDPENEEPPPADAAVADDDEGEGSKDR